MGAQVNEDHVQLNHYNKPTKIHLPPVSQTGSTSVADRFLLEFICVSFFIQVSILRFGESRVHFFQGASSYLDTWDGYEFV
jgi:hypothetical protein